MKVYPFIISDRAQAELDLAAKYYESREIGLGARFLRAALRRCNLISTMPYGFPLWKRSARIVTVPRFPYAIIYCVGRRAIDIFAVVNTRSDSRNWPRR